jgi:hypothetical protein
MLDLRLPIGYFFMINGGLLILDGLASPHAVSVAGQMFNLDLVWGTFMALFGVMMTALAWLDKKKSGAGAGRKES